MKNSHPPFSITIGERARSADRALKLFQALRDDPQRNRGSSGCVVVSTAVGCELVLESDESALARLSELLREGGKPMTLLNCSAEGKIGVRMLENDAAFYDLMMARVRETFEAMHYARLLYPSLRGVDQGAGVYRD